MTTPDPITPDPDCEECDGTGRVLVAESEHGDNYTGATEPCPSCRPITPERRAREMGYVGIPASEDPNDLSINEWQMLDFALGDVDAATHDAVMSTARQIRVNARTECLGERDAEAPQATESVKVTHMGLTHDCDDPECHVAGFVRTLTLHMPAELAPAYRGAALLRLAADALEAQPPKLRAQYVAALRLYADEPWLLTGGE